MFSERIANKLDVDFLYNGSITRQKRKRILIRRYFHIILMPNVKSNVQFW